MDLHENQLTELPDSISLLSSLELLWVYDNPITSTLEGRDEVVRRFGRDELELEVVDPEGSDSDDYEFC